MIDIKLLKEDHERAINSLRMRNVEYNTAELLDLDEKRRSLILKLDRIKKERNENSALIGKGQVSQDEKSQLILTTKELGETIKKGDVELRDLNQAIQSRLLEIPNLIHETTPEGKSEEDNQWIRKWGEQRSFEFEPLHHSELGEQLDILDAPRGVKLAQSRFTLVKGAGATLERALINFMLNVHTGEHGYQEFVPPFLVNADSMTGTGQLPKFEEDLFKTTGGLYLIPSAEVPITNIHSGEILKEEELPKYYTAYSPCFRSEAGSYGKDTKGYIRQHQFNKVELVKLSHPANSFKELELLLLNAEEILKQLKLPYQVLELCSGDLGFSAAKCYDIEVWMPGEGKYREISSCSNCTDFQARRAGIRFKPKEGGKTRFVHTLNGSGLAVGRTLAAILENNQQEDGSVIIPEVLVPYMNGLTKISASS